MLPPLAEAEIFKGVDILSQKPFEISTKEKGALLVFISSQCPCSNSHLAHLNSLHTQYPEIPLVGVLSNYGENSENAAAHFKSQGVKFPVLHDPEAKLADKFNALKTPHAFLMDAESKIIYKGGVSSSHDFPRAKKHFLADALKQYSQNKTIEEPEGRALGCSITRKMGNPWLD